MMPSVLVDEPICPASAADRHPHRPTLIGFAFSFALLLTALGLSSAASAVSRAELRDGRDIYAAACVACHGPNGTGNDRALIGFEPPANFPDFTQCDQTTPEQDVAWKSVIRDGGPSRGFAQIMPAFGSALSAAQIDAVVGYLRHLCTDAAWPRGELNLPRALNTEKAFPENEIVLTSSFNAEGPRGSDHELAYEHRLGKHSQLELAIPFSVLQRDSGAMTGGIGDIAVGLKQVLASRLASDGSRGQILSVQGEVVLPTGDEARGFGTGETIFAAFAAYDALLPANWFVQLQGGLDVPRHTQQVPRTAFLRSAFGKSIAERNGYGRRWSPMLEFVGERDLDRSTGTRWDVIPELQVTLSTRQHVRAALGYRIPVSTIEDRPRQVMLYVLWDWFDGGLFEGW